MQSNQLGPEKTIIDMGASKDDNFFVDDIVGAGMKNSKFPSMKLISKKMAFLYAYRQLKPITGVWDPLGGSLARGAGLNFLETF